MRGKIEDLFVLEQPTNQLCFKTDALYKRLISAAEFFGFTYLPDELRIQMKKCDKNEFNNKRKTLLGGENDQIIAFTCNVNQIFFLEYRFVENQYSHKAYNAVIIHESIHVFQAYYSELPPSQYVWLYESVACYLAGQKIAYNPQKNVSWNNFVEEFYNIENCYGLAYKFGEALFRLYGDEVLCILKSPEEYEDKLIEVYNSIFLK